MAPNSPTVSPTHKPVTHSPSTMSPSTTFSPVITASPTFPPLPDDPYAIAALFFAALLIVGETWRMAGWPQTWAWWVFAGNHLWLVLTWSLFGVSFVTELQSNGSFLTNPASSTGQADLATVILASMGTVTILGGWGWYAKCGVAAVGHDD